MNGYYGFVSSGQLHPQIVLPVPTPHRVLVTENTVRRKRERPNPYGDSQDGLVNGIDVLSCFTSSTNGSGTMSEHLEYGRAKRVCLEEDRDTYLDPSHSPCQTTTTHTTHQAGHMDCSISPYPHTNRPASRVRPPHMPTPQEADIIDMNPVAVGPVAATRSPLLTMKTRKLHLCLMEDLCNGTQTMGISVLECPRCLAGEGGHLVHILEGQGMDTQ